jgi:hypothetical protein
VISAPLALALVLVVTATPMQLGTQQAEVIVAGRMQQCDGSAAGPYQQSITRRHLAQRYAIAGHIGSYLTGFMQIDFDGRIARHHQWPV